MATRLSRQERTEAVRAEVLDAARREFLAAGYHGASLDRIAAAAGYTKGAVYSRFASKADLFLALLEDRIASRRDESSALASSLSGAEGVAALARHWSDVQRRDLPWTLLVLEFRVHAARDPELNARYLALHERTVDGVEEVLRRILGEGAPRTRELALVILATGTGASLEEALHPQLFDAPTAARYIAALVRAAAD